MLKSVTQARYENFDALFEAFRQKLWRDFPDEPEKGMLRKFAARANLSDRYASHLNCKRKPMGHAVARKIELAMGLPEMWMDQDHAGLSPAAVATVTEPVVSATTGEVQPPDVTHFMQMAAEIYAQMPARALAAILPLVLDAVRQRKR